VPVGTESVGVTPPPRVCTYDIEVRQGGSGPPVVSEEGTEQARNDITAITAHDSYTDEYKVWVLLHDDWDASDSQAAREAVSADVSVYSNPRDVVGLFCEWVTERDMDVLMGWNCLPEGTPVLMADGSEKAIEDVQKGDDIVGIDGDETSVGTVTATSERRQKPTVDVVTQNGTEVTMSTEHRVLTGGADGMEWKEASDVEEGDYILRPKNLPESHVDGDVPIDPYLMGLIASDGTVERAGGVTFYNGESILHDQFPEDNSLSFDPRGNGTYSQRVFTGESNRWLSSVFEDTGIPVGSKKDKEWNLSRLYNCDSEVVEKFLAGYMDGDGNVSNNISLAASNPSARYWIMRLLRRIGIWGSMDEEVVHVGSGSVRRFRETVGRHMNHPSKVEALGDMQTSKSGIEGTIPPWMATHKREEDGRVGFRVINDKIRREINVKRWEAEEVDSPVANQYSDFVFERVSEVRSGDVETCYDISTTLDSFVADDIVVHNSNGFDTPYLVNWALRNDVNAVYGLSPTRDVYEMNGNGNWINSDLKGRLLIDLMEMYKKCKIHELPSYSLEDVAEEEEVAVGKLSLEDTLDVPEGEPAIDYAWKEYPETFVEYSVRDVKAAVGVNSESQKKVNII
jgi:intein/homing endonuclease